MKSRVLTHIQQALMKLALWRGWTTADRVMLRQMADQCAEMNRRNAVRHTALRREGGSKHVQHR